MVTYSTEVTESSTEVKQSFGATQAEPPVSERAVRWAVVALTAILVMVAILVGVRLNTRLQPTAPAPHPPLAVETVVIEPRPFVQSSQATGTVMAEHRAMLSAQLAAKVTKVMFREGAHVGKGDVLIRLDDDEQQQEVSRLEAAVERVAADVAYWREQLATDRELLNNNSIGRRAFDETKRRLAALEASLSEAQQSLKSGHIRLRYATVTSPFEGYVQSMKVLPGELVQPGTPMVELLAASPLKAVVQISETDLAGVEPGQPVRVQIDATNGEWPGHVDRIYPGLDPATRNATLEIVLPEDANSVRPGMAATVEIIRQHNPAALVLPYHALRHRDGEEGVYIESNETAKWQSVQPGAVHNGMVEIVSGLNPGDTVIVTPHPQLTDGRMVAIRNHWRGGSR